MVFGGVALAIGPYFKNYLESVLTTLQQASQAQVDKVSLKRAVVVKKSDLLVFGDEALAIGPYFKNYLESVLTTLHQASQAQVDKVKLKPAVINCKTDSVIIVWQCSICYRTLLRNLRRF